MTISFVNLHMTIFLKSLAYKNNQQFVCQLFLSYKTNIVLLYELCGILYIEDKNRKEKLNMFLFVAAYAVYTVAVAVVMSKICK